MEYPEGTLAIYKNEIKSETNYPIQIREPRRSVPKKEDPQKETIVATTKDGIKLVYVCTPILTLVPTKERSVNSGCVIIRLNVRTYYAVPVPQAEVVKERWVWVEDDGLAGEGGSPENFKVAQNKDGESVRMRKVVSRYDVFVRLDSKELLPYLERLMRNRLENYKSNEPGYGCCHLYKECSDAKRCLSKDKIYATVCAYRKNLEAGRIFYGKNKNV